MSSETKVYQVTYLRDGRDLIVGDEIMGIDTAAQAFYCARGHTLKAIYHREPNAANVWWIACNECGAQTFVRRYDRIADMKNAGERLARRRKVNAKAPADLMEQLCHHPKPFASLDAALEALAQEQDALDGIAVALDALTVLERS